MDNDILNVKGETMDNTLKPIAPKVIAENIPTELKDISSWLVWKYEQDGERWIKRPYPANGSKSFKANKAETWSTFQAAYEKYEKGGYDGIGFVFNRDYTGIDIDHCISKETGVISETALSTVEKMGTYTELSPSGTGLHIISKGTYEWQGLNDSENFGPVGYSKFEIYQHDHYFTVTGNTFEGNNLIRECGEDLQAVVNEESARRKAHKESSSKTNPGTKPTISTVGMENSYNPTTVSEVIETMKAHDRTGKIHKLFEVGDISDYGGDDSGADMALMNLLPFWCKGDRNLMKAVFMESALAERRAKENPKKYNRADYWERTMDNALKSWNGECYNPSTYGKIMGESETVLRINAIPKGAARLMNWPDVEIHNDGTATPRKVSPLNMAYLLKRLDIHARFNLVTKREEYTGDGATYTNTAGIQAILGKEKDENAVALNLRATAAQLGWKVYDTDFRQLLTSVVKADSYSPVCEYLTGAMEEYKAEGEERNYIHELFQKIEVNPTYADNTVLYEKLFRKWLIGAVMAAYNTLDKRNVIPGVLVFTGKTNIGKSTFLKCLIPYMGRNWIEPGKRLDVADKDSKIETLSYWIVELDELSDLVTDKRKKESFKSFITNSNDEYRRSYGRKATKEPRTTTFLGTTNEEHLILDEAMGRRLWIIPVIAFHCDRLNFSKPNPSWESFIKGVWGQAAAIVHDESESPNLDRQDIAEMKRLNQNFESLSSVEQTLLDSLDPELPQSSWQEMKSTDVCKAVGIPPTMNSAMGKALNHFSEQGIVQKVMSHKRGRLYLVPLAERQPPQLVNFPKPGPSYSRAIDG